MSIDNIDCSQHFAFAHRIAKYIIGTANRDDYEHAHRRRVDPRFLPPDPTVFPTLRGFFLEMSGSTGVPRALLTPWGGWFCFGDNVCLPSLSPNDFPLDRLKAKRFNEPNHAKTNVALYSLHRLPMCYNVNTRMRLPDPVFDADPIHNEKMNARIDAWKLLQRRHFGSSFNPEDMIEQYRKSA